MTLLLLVSGGWRPSARWRDAPDASIRLTSFNIEGLMCGIKVPQQDFVLKMPGGGLMREGGCICRTLRYFQCEARYSEQVQGTGQLSSCGLPVQSSLRLQRLLINHKMGTVCFLTTYQQPATCSTQVMNSHKSDFQP